MPGEITGRVAPYFPKYIMFRIRSVLVPVGCLVPRIWVRLTCSPRIGPILVRPLLIYVSLGGVLAV